MGAAPVVMALVLGQDSSQMPFAEDEHPIGDFRPGGEYEPFRISVRERAPGTRPLGRDVCRIDPVPAASSHE